MHPGVAKWVPELHGEILEVGKFEAKGQMSPYPKSFGVNIREGPGVDLICDARQLPFEDGQYDHVVCLETLEHIQGWREVVVEMWRVTDITLLITTPTIAKCYHGYPYDYWRWTLEQWFQVFSKQKVMKAGETWKAGIGIWVYKKSDELDLSVEPAVVDDKGRRQKVRK